MVSVAEWTNAPDCGSGIRKDFVGSNPILHPNIVSGIDKHNLCDNLELLNGAYAQYIVIPKNIVEQNNLHNRVIYLGWCGGARLEAFYNSIDVLVITSIYEPFGMVALEAIARGIPVVCNRIGGLHEILENNAFFYEKESYDNFHKAMLKWLNTDTEKIQLKTRDAYTRYSSHFTDIEMTKKYLKLVEEIVSV